MLPGDLREFYELCGGATLFRSASYTCVFVPPEQVVPANPVIVGEKGEGDLSEGWYIIASDGQGEYLTIDCHPARLGRCYDSFSDRHGVRGSCPIIATSFGTLLQRLLDGRGSHWYWLRPEFQSLGDAYD
jgi:antitoxin YokJ